MYPHRIRLRGPWEFEPLAHLAGAEPLPPGGRMTLPARWADAGLAGFAGRVRFLRRFGYPGQIDADERVWLTCAGWSDRADVALNGASLAQNEPGTCPFEYDITSLLRPRNELTLELTGPANRGGIWGEVALEVRCLAFLREVRAQPILVNGSLELEVRGVLTGTADGELELYAILQRHQALYARLTPSAAGQAFCLHSEGLPATYWEREAPDTTAVSVRIDLVKGASVWYTVTQELLLPPGRPRTFERRGMDIEVLRVRVTQEELTSLTEEHAPADTGVQGLRISLTAEGIHVAGQYTTMLLPISFETLWEPMVVADQLQAKLARITVAGFPATKLRGVLLKVLADSIGAQPGVHFEGELVRLDLKALLAHHKIPVRVKPTAVTCTPGFLVLEAGV